MKLQYKQENSPGLYPGSWRELDMCEAKALLSNLTHTTAAATALTGTATTGTASPTT